MTTAITIDAHAGWDIEVQTLTTEPNKELLETFIIPAGTKEVVYIWHGKEIVYIAEIVP